MMWFNQFRWCCSPPWRRDWSRPVYRHWCLYPGKGRWSGRDSITSLRQGYDHM